MPRRASNVGSTIGHKAQEDVPEPGQSATRTRPVRITADLTPAAYGDLRDWIELARRESGRGKLPINQVIVTLVQALLTDEHTASVVTDLLKR